MAEFRVMCKSGFSYYTEAQQEVVILSGSEWMVGPVLLTLHVWGGMQQQQELKTCKPSSGFHPSTPLISKGT